MDVVSDSDHEEAMAKLAGKPRQSEWETYMSHFQKTSAEAGAE
ncbi:MAG: L-rhamnose mutarotase [Chlorobi bacterium]|nr:L-rhamnose mutarotase [Chlorobiota bacterium]